jgi:hypothetical protein
MNLCFVTPRFPYPPVQGDQVRVYHQIRTLSARHRITLISACERDPDESARAEMGRWCEFVRIVPAGGMRAVLPLAVGIFSSRLPLQALYYRSEPLRRLVARTLSERTYDVVHASLLRIAPSVQDVAPPVVIDLTDAVSRSIAARLPHMRRPMRDVYAFEQQRTERYEREVCARFRRSVVCAQADADALGMGAAVIPNAVDTERFSFAIEPREDGLIVMTGNMGYHPNVDGVVWFTTHVWPLIRLAVPDARF